jgi:muconate cycloisomerase
MSPCPPVRIAAFELFAVDLPFRFAFKHAAAERSCSDSVFLKCVTGTGVVGFGECLPRVYVTGETRDGAFDFLRDRILPRLLGREFASLLDVEAFLMECDGRAPAAWVDPRTPQGAAWCAVDLALLDAFGQSFNERPLAGLPAAPSKGLRYSGVLSAERGLKLALLALGQRCLGLRQFKVKVGPETTEAAVRRLRALVGKETDLRADVNMGWTVDEAAERMALLARYGIRSFEQPIAVEDLKGQARLVAETGLQVMADESFTTRESLQALIDGRACTAVSARISKCGGLVATLNRCREALAAGLVVQIGCQVGESSLLSSAHLLLSAAVQRVTYAEGCFGRLLLRADPARPVLRFGPGGRPPRRPPGPGLGITIEEAILARYAVRRERVAEGCPT